MASVEKNANYQMASVEKTQVIRWRL